MHSSVVSAFEVDNQSGQTISNIGGDQTIYYGDRGRAARVAKILAAVGLLLCLVGAASLVAVGVTMYDGSRLAVHLTAIFVAVVVLTATVAGLAVRPPRDVVARP